MVCVSVCYAHSLDHRQHTQSMRAQRKQACPATNAHKVTIPYLHVHSVAFKYNVADLNTVGYSVKLQGNNKANI